MSGAPPTVGAVVFDIAGTTLDPGSRAPLGVFQEVFRRRGVEVSEAEARGPMGTEKREHIRRMCADPALAARWTGAHGAPPGEADIDGMFAALSTLALEVLPRYAIPIEGVLPMLSGLEARGIGWAATTGYSRPMLDVVLAAAARHGYHPPVALASTDVPEGRPAPFLIWRALTELGVYPAFRAVKVGDTVPDMQAGRNAGVWTVGVARTGNLSGSSDAWQDLRAAGAHLILDRTADLPRALVDIERRLAAGQRP